MTPSFTYRAVSTRLRPAARTRNVLHTMLWKFFVIDFTRVDTDKLRFEPTHPWKAAVLRVDSKVQARHAFLSRQATDALEHPRP